MGLFDRVHDETGAVWQTKWMPVDTRLREPCMMETYHIGDAAPVQDGTYWGTLEGSVDADAHIRVRHGRIVALARQSSGRASADNR